MDLSENMQKEPGTQELTLQVQDVRNRNVKAIKLGKLILGAMIIFGLLFPDFIWNYDTVTVTDRNGRDVTDEMSGQDIYEGIYSTDNIEFSFSWLN